MKTFKKVLASTLAAAMVVTALPVTPANAAAAPKLSTKKATVYVGQSKTIKVTTPKAWKSVKVKATTSKKSVATVKASKKKVTVKAVKAGTAKVTVKVTGKKSGKAVKKTLKATITVKNPSLTLKAASAVAVGAKETVKATVKPASTKVTFSSSDDAIATVDATTGEVTGVKAGKVTITAKAGKTTKTVDMEVKTYVFKSVKQTKADTLEAVVSGKTSDIKASDIKVTNTVNNNVIAVKAVTVDKADATKVTITTFAEMVDGAKYNVELAGTVKDFTATDGVVADVNVTPVQVPANTDGTKINGQLVDKNGIVVKEFLTSTKPANVDFTLSTTQGYVNGDAIVLPVVGNKGTAEITYHTYKYDEKAQEVGAITKKVEITAVADTPVTTTGYELTIVKSGDKVDWAKKNNQFSASDKTMVANFRFMGSDNKEITDDYSKYTVVSSDDSVLLLAKTPLAKNAKTVAVRGVKAGTAYINVLKDNKVVTSLPVVVTADRKLANIKIATPSLTVASNVNSTISTDVKGVDQYGADFGITSITATVMNKNTATADGNLSFTSGLTDKVEINASGVKAGTYNVKVEAKTGNDTITRVITVNVVKASVTDPAQAKSLGLKLSATDVDLAIGADTTANDIAKKNIKVSVVAYSEGAVIGEVTATDVKVNGKSDNVTGDTIALTKTTDGKVVKNFTAGTYVVSATAAGKTFTGTFTVKDTQSTNVVAKIVDKKTTADITSAAAVVAANVEFSINGADYAKLDAAKISVDAGQYKTVADAIYVGTVKVTVTNNVGVSYEVSVNVNTTFTK
uniref:Ig-like domain-containing protein n=1 Tax=Agathobacter sp. TaxID=2021311 RepID=UPI004028A37B